MELDSHRPHNHFRTSSTGGSTTATTPTPTDLFICFTSRLSSSSSMKLSKSLLSPGRAARDAAGPTSLSSSLSRRLRTNGSLKGGASPFFTTTGKKRGCAFDNPEPSSPKVTCIGQVRVKTKKKVKRSRSLSRRRSGEISFRKIDTDGGGQQMQMSEDKIRHSNASAHYQPQECLPHRNQRWVHLPVSICEALRAFGAEFSCLFPCKSSCFSSTGERDQKADKDNEGGCGAVFARWLVSVNDGEGGKRREIELVVGGGDAAEEERLSMRSSRRHVFEDIEVKDDKIEEEAAGRVSICIPPKNALLLMRCRSDPMKMAALANRFTWDAKIDHCQDIEEEHDEITTQEDDALVCEEQVKKEEEQVCDDGKDEVFNEQVEIPDEVQVEIEELCDVEDIQEEEMVEDKTEEFEQETAQEEEVEEEEEEEEEKEEVESNMSSFEELLEQENTDNYEDCPIPDKEQVEDHPIFHLSPSSQEEDVESNNIEAPPLLEEAAAAMAEENEATEESNSSETEEEVKHVISQLKLEPEEEEEQTEAEMENRRSEEPVVVSGNEDQLKRERGREKVLPECLLLMMCEPKLSMEVSKETWVCSTDFIRWLPERPRKAAAKPGNADHEPVKRRLSIDSKPKAVAHAVPFNEQLPPRSSCSLPAAAASMATMIEQKLVNAVGYEPFVLTRCKSEPMRTAAAKLVPESCFWKNAMRKLEPHRRGVGAAGVGF